MLRHGAYDIFNEEKNGDGDAASIAFVVEDIDSIMAAHSRTVVHETTGNNTGGSKFSKASFLAKTPDFSEDVDLEDPDFWKKIVGEAATNENDDNVITGPRQRVQANYADRNQNYHIDSSSYDSDEGESNDEDSQVRSRWGGGALSEWNKDDVENLIKALSSFGYGILPWDNILQHLGLTKNYGLVEVRARHSTNCRF